MKGLEISREFYFKCGKPMLEELFSDFNCRIAAGLVGEGSECFGYDDEISKDHDFSPDFCLWITREDEKRFGFSLERAYSKLPKEFMGLKRGHISPVGGSRRGVIVIEDFYTRFLGMPRAPQELKEWLYIPSSSLAAVTNGEVFKDSLGVFSSVRNILLRGYPEDIRRKRLAAHIIFMAQSGQYNYPRCILRGELGAAQLAIYEFVRHTISAIYLLNNKYEPFYKWVYKALKGLLLGDTADSLQAICELDNSEKNTITKKAVIEDIATLFIAELKNQGLLKDDLKSLEEVAYSICNSILDSELRNMHIMDGDN